MELNIMPSSRTTMQTSVDGEQRTARDFFEKCENYGREIGGRFLRVSEIQASGLYVYFERFEGRDGCAPGYIWMDGRKVLMFGSNDYLDLITHPKVQEAATAAVARYGT